MKEYTIKISEDDIFLLIGLASSEAERFFSLSPNDYQDVQDMLRRLEVQVRLQGGPSAEMMRQYEETKSRMRGR